MNRRDFFGACVAVATAPMAVKLAAPTKTIATGWFYNRDGRWVPAPGPGPYSKTAA